MTKPGYCSGCGRYHMSPAPHTCARCGGKVEGGCSEGDRYQLVGPAVSSSPVSVHIGGKIGRLNIRPPVMDRVKTAWPVNDHHTTPGEMIVEFLPVNTRTWRDVGKHDDGDPSMYPGVRRW